MCVLTSSNPSEHRVCRVKRSSLFLEESSNTNEQLIGFEKSSAQADPSRKNNTTELTELIVRLHHIKTNSDLKSDLNFNTKP